MNVTINSEALLRCRGLVDLPNARDWMCDSLRGHGIKAPRRLTWLTRSGVRPVTPVGPRNGPQDLQLLIRAPSSTLVRRLGQVCCPTLVSGVAVRLPWDTPAYGPVITSGRNEGPRFGGRA